MSTTSAAHPASGHRLSLLARPLVTSGLAAVVAIASSPLAGVLAGVAAALVGLVVRAPRRASPTVERILDEELDRRDRAGRSPSVATRGPSDMIV